MNNTIEINPCYDTDSGLDVEESDKDLIILNHDTVNVETNLDANKEKKERRSTCKKELNEENVEGGKKKHCRKVNKNPFFTNRLKFSTDLPPRPPLPPPQFFPSSEDPKPKVCQKKKKCKKDKSKLDGDQGGAGGGEEDEEEGEEEDEEEEGEECEPCVCNYDDDNDKARKRCKKGRVGKVPCRKKVSESSIPPQPKRIPALLKDLPLTCPKDIPEVKRQIRMSQDNNFTRNDQVCKKKCKRKEAVEQILNF